MRIFYPILVGVVVGWATSGMDFARNVRAQPGPGPLSDGSTETLEVKLDSPPFVGRFHVSAYGSQNAHGCYIVDTMTGKMWHSNQARAATVVNEGLLPTPHSPIIHPAKSSKGLPSPGLKGGPDLAR